MAALVPLVNSNVPLGLLLALDHEPPTPVRYPVPKSNSVFIDGKNQIVLSRDEGHVYAFALACPHQNTALREAKGGKGFQCPRHKSKYLPDGTFVSGKATRNMDRLEIHHDGDTILVNPDVFYRSDLNPGEWAKAVVSNLPD